jgi:hypothetical protein
VTRPLVPTVLVLTALSFLATESPAASPAAPRVVADSVREFSGQQGANGWFYGYWDRSADRDDTYDPATDFALLRHFGRDPKNGLMGHSGFTTGELWNLEDGRFYTSLWAEGGHPHGKLNLGSYAQAEHWVVRRWVSTVAGEVTIRGQAGKVMPWGENWTGGVQALLVVDGKPLFRADLGNNETAYAIEATVRVGSRVDFLLRPNPSIGVMKFTATIEERDPASTAARPRPR